MGSALASVFGVFMIGLYFLVIALFIIMVLSIKRIAAAQQELVNTNKDIAKQLATIAIEIRNSGKH